MAARAQYQEGNKLVPDLASLMLAKDFSALSNALNSAHLPKLADLESMVSSTFRQSPSTVVASKEFTSEFAQLCDAIVAIVLLPELHTQPLDKLTTHLRLMDLVKRIAASDASLEAPAGMRNAFGKVVLLPQAIFPLREDIPSPRMGDLLVVRQNLKRYETAEIGQVENVLVGETRTHTAEHTLTLQQTTTNTTSTVTQTTDELSTTDQFSLTNAANSVINEDLKTQAGLNVSASYGTVQMNATASVAYDQSKSDSTQSAVSHAKNVTSRAVKNIIESVSQQQVTQRNEVFQDTDVHGFANPSGPGAKNISGLYQWLTKIYECQIFNYGQRMLLDLVVPEPAAFLLDAVSTQAQSLVPPIPFMLKDDGTGQYVPLQPSDFDGNGAPKSSITTRPLQPSDLDTDTSRSTYYGSVAAMWGAQSNAPPEPYITVAKSISGDGTQSGMRVQSNNDINIPAGYKVSAVYVNAVFSDTTEPIDGDEELHVLVGPHSFKFGIFDEKNKQRSKTIHGDDSFLSVWNTQSWYPQSLPDPTGVTGSTWNPEVSNISVSVIGAQVDSYVINVDITCSLTDVGLENWRIQTFNTIQQSYLKLLSDFNDKKAENAFRGVGQISLGGNPDINLSMSKLEIKKACVALLTGTNIDYLDKTFTTSRFAGVDSNQGFLPNINSAPTAQDQGEYIRFFEQAFEWENMTFLYYPYFWGRKGENKSFLQWQKLALMANDDPQFLSFLQAGAARVVIPIRPQLEPLAMYFLTTGLIWGGGSYSGISDAFVLPIAQELRDQEDAGSEGVPQGPAWELRLPTTFLKLREDSKLPIWKQFSFSSPDTWTPASYVPIDGARRWVPGETDPGGNWKPDYGSVDGAGDYKE